MNNTISIHSPLKRSEWFESSLENSVNLLGECLCETKNSWQFADKKLNGFDFDGAAKKSSGSHLVDENVNGLWTTIIIM